MKKELLAIILVLFIKIVYCQSYVNLFNGLDDLQGYSFNSNINGELHWGQSPRFDNYISIYRKTENINYLNKLLIHIKRIQERRDDNINNLLNNSVLGTPGTYINLNCDQSINPNNSCVISNTGSIDSQSKGWSYIENKCNCVWTNRVLHSANITFPMADFIYLIKTTPTLQSELLPTEAAGSYLGATNLINFLDFANWLQGRVNETIQFHDDNWCILLDEDERGYHTQHDGCVSGRDAFNMQCAMGRTLAMMYLVESLPGENASQAFIYNLKLNTIAIIAYNHLQTFSNDPEAYTWQHRWVNPNPGSVEDITHAWMVMSFADICFTYGVPSQSNKYFWSTDMQKFSNTMANYIYKNPLNFALNTAGTNNVNTDQLDGGSNYNALNALGPYVFLSKYNPDIYQMLSDVYYNNPLASGGALSAYPQLALYQNVFNPVGVKRNTFSDSQWAGCAGGDFNGDGIEEFATLRNKEGSVEVYSLDNNGNITQQYNSPNSYPNNWAACAAGDLDNTLGDEIIGINNNNNTLYAFKVASGSITEIAQFITPYSNWKGIAIGDVVSSNNGNEIAVLKDNGLVSFYKFTNNQFTLIVNEQTNVGNAVGITIGEFDSDNPGNEIAIINNSNGHLNIYKLDNSNGYSLQLINSFTATNGTYNNWNGLTSGDFDNDAIDEIVAHRNYDGDFFVFKITNGQLLNNYIEYFPTDTQHGVMGTMKYKGKDALVALRNYDGNIFAFTLDGYCPGMEVSSNITEDNSIDNTYSSVHNQYTLDYHSNNTLTASNMIIQDGTLSNNETVKVEFVSGKEVIFKPGFSVIAGAEMDAYIDIVNLACDNNFNLRMAHTTPGMLTENQAPALNAIKKESIISETKTDATMLTLQVNPNPNDGLFTIQFNKNINHGKVIIYDCISKPIAEFNLLNNSSFEIDITNEAKGIYLVQFITADFNATKRIVKH